MRGIREVLHVTREFGDSEDPAKKSETDAQTGNSEPVPADGPVVVDLDTGESSQASAPDDSADDAVEEPGDAPEIADAEIVEDIPGQEVEIELAEPEPVNETVLPEPEPVPAPPPARSGGTMSAIVVAILAVVLGFILSYVVPRDALPGWLPPLASSEAGDEALAEQRASFERLLSDQKESFQVLLRDQAAVIEGLQADLAQMAERPVEAAPAPDLSEDFAALRAQLAAMQGDLSGLADRPVTVEGDEAATAAIAALQAEIAMLTDRLASIETPDTSRIEELEAALAETNASAEAALAAKAEEAEGLAQALADAEAANADVTAKAAAATAMAALRSAVETGAPYGEALAAYGAATGAAAPEALAATADTGVTPLAILERDFADAARDALDASVRATMGTETGDRVGAFVRSQLKLRSLTPREGDDPDAVLSRAEAALRDGGLAQTLEELAALPEAGQAAMSDWMALASARQAALDAAAALTPPSDN